VGILDRKTVVTNQTDQFDMRVVGGDGSVNVSGSDNVISTTDHGAVSGSIGLARDTVGRGFDLALRGIETSHEFARESQAATGGLLDGALKMVGEQQQQHSQALENIKGNDVRTLVIAGMVVFGIAAVALFKRG
jgi:hypothetical protein